MYLRLIRNLIWLYFWLLIFEGVLRKWVFPQYSNILLVIRDPLVITIYFFALARGVFPYNKYVLATCLMAFFTFVFSLFNQDVNLVVMLFGLKANFLHLPLVFLIPSVFDQRDVIKMGRWILLLSIPMTFLMVLQFRADPDDILNYGPGAVPGAQIRAAIGKIRPPGYFSYITGAAQFLALLCAFLLYGFLQKATYNRILLIISGICLVICTAVSSSRLVLGSIGLVLMTLGLLYIYNRRILRGYLRLIIAVGVVLLIATNLNIYFEGRHVFEARLEETGDLQRTFSEKAASWSQRIFGDLADGFRVAKKAPVLGYGLGVGTNVGAKLLRGRLGFLLAEGEWARVILEIGPIFGFAYILLRLSLIVHLFRQAVLSARQNLSLPMLLFGSCGLLFLMGQFSQSTTVGFTVLAGGLTLAATRVAYVRKVRPEIRPAPNLQQHQA